MRLSIRTSSRRIGSGTTSQATAAMASSPPVTASPTPKFNRSAMKPTTIGPSTAPRSADIWNPASTGPPRTLGPMMSATAAC